MPKTLQAGLQIAIELDRASEVPLYRQILDQLRDAILSGRLAAGSRMPSTRIFADELKVSRNTILQVFDLLKSEELLGGQTGAGTFVTTPQALPVAPPPMSMPPGAPALPFRALSRRGKNLVASATGAFAEKPTPFLPDQPDLREFPIKTWMRILNETSGRLTGQILAETSSAGYEPLRQAIAQHLNAARGMNCEAAQVIITTGTQQGLDLVCRMLLDPGDPVWLEDPGYVGAHTAIRANGGHLYPVPVDGEGIDVSAVIDHHPVPRMIFCSPSCHYPSGAPMPLERRQTLLETADRCGAWIVEDDYDYEFIYDGDPCPALFALDGQDRTIHMGTFSKILLPSLRLGYIVVPKDFAAAFAQARGVVDRHSSLIEQMVLSEVMHRGLFVSHIRKMKKLYRHRRDHMRTGLEALLGPEAWGRSGRSGTNLLLPLASGVDDGAIAARLARRGLMVRPLSPYVVTRSRPAGLILGFAAFRDTEIDRGLDLLAHCLPLQPAAAPRSRAAAR
ncbi:aminotransferase class I/II-fold pyridoxal phosphate-dependent enzyme [Pseudooceanicola sp. GBMRC 2024]|uniref:Aminotransferase class I/II-fold pyridoxal phosphate-dependent enzyme n=1 Tax=Pseudooceanicola albus TaxID=2692189 RepID=A0A6L7G197_9RHOB|nr:PLP-dependent aminotransferase family protein [Pseudooceanicola albus]MXN17821.1 aminotransferase class I/II-fold pyridoxal phosphate-dependent enzyme [Pseudooceanicola albus]